MRNRQFDLRPFCSPLRGEGYVARGTGVDKREGIRSRGKLDSLTLVIRQFGLRPDWEAMYPYFFSGPSVCRVTHNAYF
jgi:hypothetical protein